MTSYILYQYHHCQTTQPLLLEQLREWDIDISSGQINQILLQRQNAFHAEKDDCLHAGLAASSYVAVDDSGHAIRVEMVLSRTLAIACLAGFKVPILKVG